MKQKGYEKVMQIRATIIIGDSRRIEELKDRSVHSVECQMNMQKK
jgi:hypothetical protein